MNVIIVGCGKIGYTLAKHLSPVRDVNVTIIDNDAEAFEKAKDSVDAMFVKGNGLSANTLIEAGAKEADLIVSVANADETNVLCCISAKRLGTKYTVARVRDPEYALELNKLWRDLGIDKTINPELDAAREISRLLRFPAVDNIDTFVGDRVELVSIKVEESGGILAGRSVAEVFKKNKAQVLLAAITRGDTAIIPHGDVIIEKNDVIMVLGRPSGIMDFLDFIGKKPGKIKDTMVIGGSRITHYLVGLLDRHNIMTKIKVIEKDMDKCEAISEAIAGRRCIITNGDGTDEEFLLSESIDKMDSVVCLTDRDEQNIIISLYSLQIGVKKVIAKVDHINQNMVKNLNVGSIVCPKNITAEHMVRLVRGLMSASGDNIKTMYKIYDGQTDSIEAVEFTAEKGEKYVGIPIKQLKLKKDIIIGCIVRNSNIIIPTGDSIIQPGDSVIVISKNKNLLEPGDILAGWL